MASQYQRNPWINFLRQYGPMPRNDNMYDESIQRKRHRSKIAPIYFEVPHLDPLISNFQAAGPKSVILTGTAGDGKTYLCREVWEALGGSFKEWNSQAKLRQIVLPSNLKLTIIKDLSELGAEAGEHLARFAEVLQDSKAGEVFLVAANDGQLVEAWQRVPESPAVIKTRQLIEDMLVSTCQETAGIPLLFFNLSQTQSSELLPKILRAVIDHEGWKQCDGCLGQSTDLGQRCPIWENYTRVKDTLFQSRFTDMLDLCDHNDLHLPIRQLLLLASNALLGHPDAKDQLMGCADVPDLIQTRRAYKASLYQNVFGYNLRRRRQAEVFQVLSGFGVGEETSNRIDNVVIFGRDDRALRPYFDRLIGNDAYYGAHDRYLALQTAYLEGSDEEASQEFLDGLPSHRQRLFFTMPEVDAEELQLWELTVFQYAGEYLYKVLGALKNKQRPPKSVVERLARGLNRVFTGMLTTSDRELVLASSGSHSQARVSRIAEGKISVEPNKAERMGLELKDGKLMLVVSLDRDVHVRLILNLVRYEFLSRVADGALPSSFSRECYEDILSFKSQLLNACKEVQRKYGHDPSADDEMTLKILDLDRRGQLFEQRVTVKI